MATRKKKETAIANYDAEFAAYAEEFKDQEANVGGGQFFSTRGGRLKLDGNELPDSQIACVILDSVMENCYYEDTDFDADNIKSPDCYAFGRSEDTMAPHADAANPQAKSCAECPHNVFGSAIKGKGKRCQNRRRLALVSAGTIAKDGYFEAEVDPDWYAKQEAAYLKLSPTMLRPYASYIKTLAASKRPPFGAFTKIKIEPSDATQIAAKFELLDNVPAALAPTLIERHKVTRETIAFGYQRNDDAEPEKKATKKKTTKKKTTRARR